MAMTADSPSADGVKPWAQVVRGEHESTLSVAVHNSPSSSPPPPPLTPEQEQSSSLSDNSLPLQVESSEGSNAGKGKKQAWKKPSLNGVAADVAVGPLMGGSWPALSESTKAFSPKSSPATAAESSLASSPKFVSDGSMPAYQGPVIPQMPHKQGTSNSKPNSTQSHRFTARQRSMKHGGGGSGGGGGGGGSSAGGHSQSSFNHPSQPPPPPPFPVFAMPPNGYGNMVPAMPDQSPREHTYRGNNWEPGLAGGFVPQSTDHRHSSRRGNNYGPRADGSYHNNFGGRRDQDRGHYGNARDCNVQPQRAPSRGFVRAPPPNNAAYVPTQPVRTFPNPVGFPDFVYVPTLPLEAFRGMPFLPPTPASPPAMFVTVADPQLPAMLVTQIEYYFSDPNLIKDEFLKSNMDDKGWVPITLIAGFNRVKSMTNNIPLILDSLRSSTFLEVEDDKVRRRNDWMNWIPSSGRPPIGPGLQSSTVPSYDALTSSFQNIAVEDAAADPQLEDFRRRHSTDLTTKSRVSQQEDTEDKSASCN